MSEPAGPPSRDPPFSGRLIGWAVFVAALCTISYAGRLSAGKPADDVLYRWSTAVGGAIQYALMLAIAWAIARGLGPSVTGLRRPPSWKRAAALIVGSLIVIWVLSTILGLVLKAGDEQGLVPDGWDAGRAAPFVANYVVVVLLAPFVEELVFRGVGFGLVSAIVGPWPAIVLIGLAFSLAHGLVEGLPVLALFGAVLAWLRWKTGSIYPGMIVHGIFNGVALILAVTL